MVGLYFGGVSHGVSVVYGVCFSVAEFFAKKLPVPQEFVAIGDTFVESGKPQ